MREIKFRAWDKGRGRMSPVAINLYSIDTIERLRRTLRGFEEEGRSDHLVLMQYTGLKDKNGKEIYEGDVLNIRIQNDWQSKPYVVEGMCQLFLDCNTSDSYYRISEKEIIGNIYENPELIKS